MFLSVAFEVIDSPQMKESLGMHGSELTYQKNCFTAGYVLGQIPAVMLATKVRSSLLIPSHLYAIRFLVGLCESGYFPVMIVSYASAIGQISSADMCEYLIGSWYTKEERGKRTALFYCTAALASVFSGYLQAGAYTGLDGVHGKQGWQWLFIVCGVISLPIAFLGYFFLPDFPEITRAFYIAKEEAEWQCQRLIKEGKKPLGHNPWNRAKFLQIVKQWQFWVLPLGYWFVQGSFPSYQPVMALWLKAEGHSVYQRNVWPTGQVAVGVVVQLLAGALSDSPLLKGRRWPAIVLMQAGTLFGMIVLAASNMFSYIMSIWFTNLVWRTASAPRFHSAFIAASVLGVAMIVLTQILRLLQRKDDKRRAGENHLVEGLDLAIPSK